MSVIAEKKLEAGPAPENHPLGPPAYTDAPNAGDASPLTPLSNDSELSLPAYEAVTEKDTSSSSAAATDPNFHPTASFQIESRGHPTLALPIPTRPDPIPIFAVTPSGEVGELAYRSLRASRGSGSCVLVRADAGAQPVVCATTYRFGPGKPPKLQFLDGTQQVSPSDDLVPVDEIVAAGGNTGEAIEVTSVGAFTRAQSMRTPYGTFCWRFADKSERQATGAHSLLVLDQMTTVTNAKGKQEKRRRRIAQFVRNEEFRSKGSRASTAGNGGRLSVDLRQWAESKGGAEQMEALILSSVILMMKKEVDRRRVQQGIVIAGAVGGGS